MEITITINGQKKMFSVKPGELLLDVLRRKGYFGAKKGCGNGECGTCSVLLDGRAVKSCLLFAAQAHGRELVTVEGIGTPDNPHPIQTSLVKEGAVQCGFCIPGKVVSLKGLLDRNPKPTEQEIKRALEGNLCRCTGYVKQIEAAKKAAVKVRRKKGR